MAANGEISISFPDDSSQKAVGAIAAELVERARKAVLLAVRISPNPQG
jgi:hypothetical protein